ncbi:MAG: metallophosphoesterase, partial [Candidatus Hodarchaeota archaeon]
MLDILIISDLHGEFQPFLNFFKHRTRGRGFEFVLSAGDFFSYQCLTCENPRGYHRNNCSSCQFGRTDWGKAPLQHLVQRFHPHPVEFPLPIYSSDGNGEVYIKENLWPELYKIVNQQIPNLKFLMPFETMKIKNLRILAFPYKISLALRSVLGSTPSDSQIRAFAKDLIRTAGQPNIVLSHIPPFGAADISR